ncbi:hypothetical protein PIB30_089207 [Stylosanthes scabra]|uniref:Uncharacterized protein n=1 Tax=Stylosanthes scabra TaxID=79078 RepID=A0ABU6VSC7_9FABA|nr:hypothetical protein [Stylosanthes scabra]
MRGVTRSPQHLHSQPHSYLTTAGSSAAPPSRLWLRRPVLPESLASSFSPSLSRPSSLGADLDSPLSLPPPSSSSTLCLRSSAGVPHSSFLRSVPRR